MSLETRRLLFYLFVVLFIVLGTTTVLYSQGWRFNFKTDSFQRIGGIYLNSTAADAAINLDGKPVSNQSGILQAGTLISDLIPGEHTVTVSKNGYLTWSKLADVFSGTATIFDKITLLPSGGAKSISPNASGFVLADGQPVTIENDAVSFQDHILPGVKIVAVSYGSRIITVNKYGTVYYLTDLSDIGSSLNLTALLANLRSSRLKLNSKIVIDKIAFHPFDDSRIIINASDGLYIMDTADLSLIKITPKTVNDFATSYDQLFWATDSGISGYNLVLNSSSTVFSFATGTNILPNKISVSPSGLLTTIIDKSGKLYLFDPSLQAPITIADNTQVSAFSPDSRYIAFGKYNGPLFVYDIVDKDYLDLKDNKTAAVSSLEWYKDSAHLLVLQNSDLDFTEVATGTPVNSGLISGDVSQFDYNKNTDSVYYLSPNGLFSFAITR